MRVTPFIYFWKHSSLEYSPFVLQNEDEKGVIRMKRQRSEDLYDGFVVTDVEAIFASKQQMESSEI